MKKGVFLAFKYAHLILPFLGICLAVLGFFIQVLVPEKHLLITWCLIGAVLIFNGYMVGQIIRRLNFDVYMDGLTKIGNRGLFYLKLGLEMGHKNSLNNCSFAMLDIDNFKKVNDTYGHLAGDKVLIKLAKLLNENTRSTDLVVRWGGEEFCIILPNTGTDGAVQLVERIRTKVESYDFGPEIESKKVTISIGVVSYKDVTQNWSPETNPMDLVVNLADKALYKAKEEKNKVVSYSELVRNVEQVSRQLLATELSTKQQAV